MSLPNWNSDASSNKITNTYFRGYVDISGGDVILRNGKVRSVNNTIEFDDVYYYINIPNNFHVLGDMKLLYNSIDYNVGERLACIGDIYDNKIGTMTYYAPSDFNIFNNIYCAGQIQYLETGTGNHIDLVPIVLNNQTGLTTLQNKTTNITFGTATTTISGTTATATLTFTGTLNTITPTTFGYISGLTSSAQTQLTTLATKLTNTSFATTTTTITGTTATATLTFSGTLNTVSTTTFAYINSLSSNCQTQLSGLNNRITALETKTTPFTYTAATTTLVISNIVQFTGTFNGWSTTNFSNAINYAKDLTSSAQAQINTINANSVLLANNNTFTGNQTFNGTTTTVANTLASSIFTFSTSINGATKAVFDNVMLYGNSLSENTQTAINTLKTKLTDTSYSGTTTTIANSLVFTGTLNTISTTIFGYLTGLTSNIQTQLTNLSYSINPVATIIMSPMSDIQTTSSNKYLLCDGQSVGRSSYPNLFAKIGTTFGSADPFSFNVPNYQGAFLRGYGQAMVNGQIYEGNFTVNTPQQDAIQEHKHWGQAGSYCGTNRASGITNAFASGGFYPQTYNFDQTGLQSTGRSDSGETRPMNYSVYYYIKS